MVRKWEITDADYENMKIAEVISTENDGTRYVTLSAEDISYKSEVKSDSVRVVAYPVSKASVESLSTDDIAQSRALFHLPDRITQKLHCNFCEGNV